MPACGVTSEVSSQFTFRMSVDLDKCFEVVMELAKNGGKVSPGLTLLPADDYRLTACQLITLFSIFPKFYEFRNSLFQMIRKVIN